MWGPLVKWTIKPSGRRFVCGCHHSVLSLQSCCAVYNKDYIFTSRCLMSRGADKEPRQWRKQIKQKPRKPKRRNSAKPPSARLRRRIGVEQHRRDLHFLIQARRRRRMRLTVLPVTIQATMLGFRQLVLNVVRIYHFFIRIAQFICVVSSFKLFIFYIVVLLVLVQS